MKILGMIVERSTLSAGIGLSRPGQLFFSPDFGLDIEELRAFSVQCCIYRSDILTNLVQKTCSSYLSFGNSLQLKKGVGDLGLRSDLRAE